MVYGEDQILGQVKEARKATMEEGFSGTWSNSLFRMAVTAAKRVKNRNESYRGISVSLTLRWLGESGGVIFRQSGRIKKISMYWLLQANLMMEYAVKNIDCGSSGAKLYAASETDEIGRAGAVAGTGYVV